MQLTIDADVQQAAEDGFTASAFNGAAVVLDPRNGEVLAFTSRPAYDPNAFAAGIDRATWNALNTDELKPLQNRALQGRYSPGSTFKMAVGLAGLEEGVITPRLHLLLPRRRNLLRPLFQVLEEGRATAGRPAPRDRAVLRRLLLHRRQHARRRSHQQVGDALRPRREVGHRSAQRGARAGARPRPGRRQYTQARSGTRAKRFRLRSVRDRCRSRRSRWRSTRRRSPTAAPASRRTWSRRSTTGAGLKPVPRTAAAVESRSVAGETAGHSRRHVAGRQRRRGTARPRANRRARTSAARPGPRRSSRTRDAPRRRDDEEPPRPRMVYVLRAARQPGNRRRGVPRARHSQRERRVGREAHPPDLLREEGRPAAAAAADARGDAAGSARSIRRGARRCRRATDSAMFERRLYFHIDWLLLGAVLLLAAIGVSMIYSTTYVTLPDGAGMPARGSGRSSMRVGLGVLALLVCLAIDYRFLAEHSLCSMSGSSAALLRPLRRRRAPVGRARWISLGVVQPAAVGVRADRAGADPGDVLRREPARRAQLRRSRHRRALLRSCRSC